MNRSEMKKFIQTLSAYEAAHVLTDLLYNDPALVEKAYDTAMKLAEAVDADAIKNDIFYRLDGLDADDLNSRSGRTRHGYVDPSEAAWEMFEEALDPFVYEMKKSQERALPAAAKAHCVGIVMGLLKYEKESVSDFSEWIVDAPGEYIDSVIEEWKKSGPSEEDIAEVMGIAGGD